KGHRDASAVVDLRIEVQTGSYRHRVELRLVDHLVVRGYHEGSGQLTASPGVGHIGVAAVNSHHFLLGHELRLALRLEEVECSTVVLIQQLPALGQDVDGQ